MLVNIWMVELSVSIFLCPEDLAAVVLVAVEAAEVVVAAAVIEEAEGVGAAAASAQLQAVVLTVAMI